MVNFEIEFENEIIVVFFRAENAVGVAFGNGLAHDTAFAYGELGVAGFLRPTREIFAVEQIDPVFPGKKFLRGKE
jgi:hypothetical protein